MEFNEFWNFIILEFSEFVDLIFWRSFLAKNETFWLIFKHCVMSVLTGNILETWPQSAYKKGKCECFAFRYHIYGRDSSRGRKDCISRNVDVIKHVCLMPSLTSNSIPYFGTNKILHTWLAFITRSSRLEMHLQIEKLWLWYHDDDHAPIPTGKEVSNILDWH